MARTKKPVQVAMFRPRRKRSFVCAECRKVCPDTGGYGPPLFSPDAKWLCRRHMMQAWRAYCIERDLDRQNHPEQTAG